MIPCWLEIDRTPIARKLEYLSILSQTIYIRGSLVRYLPSRWYINVINII